MTKEQIRKIVDELSLDDLVGQVLSYLVPDKITDEKLSNLEEKFRHMRPGAIFVNSLSSENIKKVTKLANKYTKIPVIVQADTENGPFPSVADCPHRLPRAMAWGACDDAELIERGGRATAQLCRKNGIHWSMAPVVDLNLLKDNPCTCTRAISDNPDQVIKMGSAYMRGLQKDGLMAVSVKHFPGGGCSDVNAHFTTAVNLQNPDEWFATYGKVYTEIFKEGPASVMTAHTSVPSLQSEKEKFGVAGYLPATVSYDLTEKLIRKDLGYNGCVISDALSMVGVAAILPEERLPIDFLNAGGDMELFAEPQYFDIIKAAVERGEVSIERLKEAVERILTVKDFVGILDKPEPEIEITEDIEKISKEIAEKSIKIVRNLDEVLPLSLKEGDHVLICNLVFNDRVSAYCPSFEPFENALKSRGIRVTVLQNPLHRDIEKVYKDDYPACVFVNLRHSEEDSSGSSMRLTWDNAMTLWRGLIFKHPKVIMTSFGDPYKLYELPYVKTYVNTFSPTIESQEAAVKVLLGEIKPQGKNPVSLKGFFEREVFPD